jgi:3-methyladenine DNA glycosylase AlkD
MANDIIASIRQELKQQADEKTKSTSQHFFKEKVIYYGVKTVLVDKIARQFFPEIKSLGKKEIFSLCEELLKSGYMEEAFIACEWAYKLNKEFEPDDFATFERWVEEYVTNWAACDTLCNHTIGAIVEKYPQFIKNLKRWAHSDNRWVKRAAAVTLIIPAKRGKFLEDIFEIADVLLTDGDDLVQKGYGWMLKEASKMHQTEVFDYIVKNKKVMPRTASSTKFFPPFSTSPNSPLVLHKLTFFSQIGKNI